MSRWLPERSVDAVRNALVEVCPEIARLPIVLQDTWEDTGDPFWSRSTAFAGAEWVVKFAWSQPAADRLEHEIQLLRTLATVEGGPPVTPTHAFSSDPVLLVCHFVAGSPVTIEAIAAYSPAQKRRLATAFADVLARFHDRSTYETVTKAGIQLPEPTPQATTDDLREGFLPMLEARQRALVDRWCNWTDDLLTSPGERVLLHGDFHGFNVIVDDTETVRVVLDVETSAYGDFHYDFRYLPAQEATLELFSLVTDEYERITRRKVDARRVMAWHVRTVLGDALWRTEAAVGLPGGGTKEDWIEELAERFAQLDLD